MEERRTVETYAHSRRVARDVCRGRGGRKLDDECASDRSCSTSAGGFAAVPGVIGSEDLTGPYEVVQGWPKDISKLPGNEKWTYGAGQGVFAESPNRILMLFRGELPKMTAPRATLLPQSARASPSRLQGCGETPRRLHSQAPAARTRTPESG